jgi:uncharacterized protein (TIGR03435 family)
MDAKWDKSVIEALETLSQDQLARERKRMLQEFLADRFQLAVHRETEHLPVYDLVIAPVGPKLQEAKPGDTYPNGFKDADGRGRAGMMHMESGRLIGQGVPVALLVKELSRELSRGLGGSIIEDKTGLMGNYDFMLQWTPEESGPSIFRGSDSTPAPESSSPSLFSALQEQLGLKLELKNGAGEILVIDHVEKPAAPEAQSTYARAPVFQLVSIEPNESSNPMRAITARSDELKVTNFTLRMLILKAYGVQGYQLSGGPRPHRSE